jgi:hypothetical protein
LLDLANLYLGGNVGMTVGQTVIYGTGLNESLINANEYWMEGQAAEDVCGDNSSVASPNSTSFGLPDGTADNSTIGFVLAPNPAGHEVIVQILDMKEASEVVVELYNSLGQQVLRKDMGTTDYLNERLDLSGLGNGLYIVSVKAGSERFEKKLIVEKD